MAKYSPPVSPRTIPTSTESSSRPHGPPDIFNQPEEPYDNMEFLPEGYFDNYRWPVYNQVDEDPEDNLQHQQHSTFDQAIDPDFDEEPEEYDDEEPEEDYGEEPDEQYGGSPQDSDVSEQSIIGSPEPEYFSEASETEDPIRQPSIIWPNDIYAQQPARTEPEQPNITRSEPAATTDYSVESAIGGNRRRHSATTRDHHGPYSAPTVDLAAIRNRRIKRENIDEFDSPPILDQIPAYNVKEEPDRKPVIDQQPAFNHSTATRRRSSTPPRVMLPHNIRITDLVYDPVNFKARKRLLIDSDKKFNSEDMIEERRSWRKQRRIR